MAAIQGESLFGPRAPGFCSGNRNAASQAFGAVQGGKVVCNFRRAEAPIVHKSSVDLTSPCPRNLLRQAIGKLCQAGLCSYEYKQSVGGVNDFAPTAKCTAWASAFCAGHLVPAIILATPLAVGAFGIARK